MGGEQVQSKPELVKQINLYLKEQSNKTIKRPNNKKHPESTQITFNCSEALLLAPQALFYSELMSGLPTQAAKHDKELLNFDPEDTYSEIMLQMVQPLEIDKSPLQKQELEPMDLADLIV